MQDLILIVYLTDTLCSTYLHHSCRLRLSISFDRCGDDNCGSPCNGSLYHCRLCSRTERQPIPKECKLRKHFQTTHWDHKLPTKVSSKTGHFRRNHSVWKTTVFLLFSWCRKTTVENFVINLEVSIVISHYMAKSKFNCFQCYHLVFSPF